MRQFLSRRALRPREEPQAGELNVVPYLDILMNLIIFVLLSMTGLALFGEVNVTLQGGSGGAVEGPPQVLKVAISPAGFTLGVEGAGSSALASKDGALDYQRLNETAQLLKAELGPASKVVVSAEAGTEYGVLMATLDALRETPDHQLLFVDVTLAER